LNPADFLNRYRAAKRQNAYEILGLDELSSPDQARAAYRRLVKQFHPDKFAGPAYRYLQKEINDYFVRINQAYEAVRNAGHSTATGSAASAPGAPSTATAGAPVYNAERRQAKAKQHYLRGLLLVQERKYAEAARFFELAIDQDPSQGPYFAQAARALLQGPLDPERKRRAELLLKTAIARDPGEPTSFYWLGRLLKDRGDMANAARLFAAAVVIKPDYHEAMREVRLLRLRKERELERNLGGAKGRGAEAGETRTRSWQSDRRKQIERRREQVPIGFPDRRTRDRRREVRRLSDLPLDKILKGGWNA
jgi:tetratricopeptide (TPR) repeat protein